MTGKELIVFILQHNLENEEIFKDGRLLGFKTVSETAIRLGVGEATVRTWVALGKLYAVKIDDVLYIADEFFKLEEH